jgi:hypothetical protein
MLSVILTVNLDTVGSDGFEVGPRNDSQTNTFTATENEGVERANPLDYISFRSGFHEMQLTLQVHRPILPKFRYSFCGRLKPYEEEEVKVLINVKLTASCMLFRFPETPHLKVHLPSLRAWGWRWHSRCCVPTGLWGRWGTPESVISGV